MYPRTRLCQPKRAGPSSHQAGSHGELPTTRLKLTTHTLLRTDNIQTSPCHPHLHPRCPPFKAPLRARAAPGAQSPRRPPLQGAISKAVYYHKVRDQGHSAVKHPPQPPTPLLPPPPTLLLEQNTTKHHRRAELGTKRSSNKNKTNKTQHPGTFVQKGPTGQTVPARPQADGRSEVGAVATSGHVFWALLQEREGGMGVSEGPKGPFGPHGSSAHRLDVLLVGNTAPTPSSLPERGGREERAAPRAPGIRCL